MEITGINSNISTESIHFTQNMETTIKIREEYKEEIDELRQHLDQEALVEKALQKLKEKRRGAKVFCVGCGAQKRTLRKWHNSYLCIAYFEKRFNEIKKRPINRWNVFQPAIRWL